MGGDIEAMNAMHGHAHELGYGGNMRLDPGARNNAVGRQRDEFAHKAVVAARAKRRPRSVVLIHPIGTMAWNIRNHYDGIAHIERMSVVCKHLAHALMNKRHGKLLAHNLGVALALEITLIGVANRHITRSNDHLVGDIDILKLYRDRSWRDKLVHVVDHYSSTPHSIIAWAVL